MCGRICVGSALMCNNICYSITVTWRTHRDDDLHCSSVCKTVIQSIHCDNHSDMDTSSPIEEIIEDDFKVTSSTSTSIHVGWQIRASVIPFVEGYRVHFQKVASTYVQYGPRLDPLESEYAIRNLVADTYYKICLVVYRNNTSPFRDCLDASTTNWQLPVSIGSSIGAVLALSMIVFIVLLSRCQMPVQYRRRKRTNSSRYDTMSSNYHEDHYEFSETATHGNDDDFVSEFDHDDERFCELASQDHTRPKHVEKLSLANGLCKNHVHPHMHVHQQHRNSVGRLPCPSGHVGHHHPRATRAYSINSDMHGAYTAHVANKRKDSQKLQTAKECHELEESFSSKSTEKCRKHALLQKQHSINRDDLLRRELDSTQRPPLLSQHSTQGFTYIDEMQDVSATANSSKLRSTASFDAISDKLDRQGLEDIKFEDLSAFGAVGGLKESFVGHMPVRHWDATQPVELSNKRPALGQEDSTSFDEHAL